MSYNTGFGKGRVATSLFHLTLFISNIIRVKAGVPRWNFDITAFVSQNTLQL